MSKSQLQPHADMAGGFVWTGSRNQEPGNKGSCSSERQPGSARPALHQPDLLPGLSHPVAQTTHKHGLTQDDQRSRRRGRQMPLVEVSLENIHQSDSSRAVTMAAVHVNVSISRRTHEWLQTAGCVCVCVSGINNTHTDEVTDAGLTLRAHFL